MMLVFMLVALMFFGVVLDHPFNESSDDNDDVFVFLCMIDSHVHL